MYIYIFFWLAGWIQQENEALGKMFFFFFVAILFLLCEQSRQIKPI